MGHAAIKGLVLRYQVRPQGCFGGKLIHEELAPRASWYRNSLTPR